VGRVPDEEHPPGAEAVRATGTECDGRSRAAAQRCARDADQPSCMLHDAWGREPRGVQAAYVAGAALVLRYAGDTAAARKLLDRATRLAEEAGCHGNHAFALYVWCSTSFARHCWTSHTGREPQHTPTSRFTPVTPTRRSV